MLDVDGSVDDVILRAKSAHENGIKNIWLTQIFGHDSLTLCGLIGREIKDVSVGTAVTPIQPRHPLMLAAQTLTVNSAVGGRLTLGVGLSHQMVIEGIFGLEFSKPAHQMEEYLEVLMPLLRGQGVQFKGEKYKVSTLGPIEVPMPSEPRVLVAALGERMLGIAGRLANGTATWMTGVETVKKHIVPTIRKVREDLNLGLPEVLVGLPVCVSDDKENARERASKVFAIYGGLPSYRAMLDREGASGPQDVAIIGSESEVKDTLLGLEGIGVTGFVGGIFGNREEKEKTLALLGSL